MFRREPDAELLRHIRLPSFIDALEAAGASLGSGFLDRPEDELLDELAAAYTGLFVGPGRHVAPRASAHLAGGGDLWGASPAEIRSIIDSAGFAYGAGYDNPCDHLSVELDFMRHLVEQEARALEKPDDAEAARYREIEKDFVTGHLALWVPVFCAKVAAGTDSPFYREMAALLEDFMQFEAEILTLDRPRTAIRAGTKANST